MTEIDMLWDSGASVSVMSERIWIKVGRPILKQSVISLCGVFSTGMERPLGMMTIEADWNGKNRQINVIVVKDIRPDFIGGVDTMEKFGIQLVEIDIIDASLVGKTYLDSQREEKALTMLGHHKNEKLGRIVIKFKDIFMASTFDLGFTRIVQHEMTITGGPVMLQPRRQPMHLEHKLDELVANLLEAKVIRKCKSAWNAPLVLVAKKDGSIRMCVDYRGLNAITEKVSFPMPDTRFLLDCLADSKLFSSIDLGQAYYQVGMAEEIQEVTAFSTRQGQFCFNRLPFGLATAPATFQRMMHTMLEGMLFKGVIVYLDDILVYGKNVEEHNARLEEVFRRIQLSGLRINAEKCDLYKEELTFLGHTVSGGGIKTNDKKIREIKEAKVPLCAKQLRSFLGMTNYYRKFIKNYAKIAEPLHAATSGCEKKINWSEECNSSFELLKKKLCEAPVLDYPRLNRKFILDTDASFGAIGAVLSQQREDGTEAVIAYGSRHLTAHEKGYCVTRKELLAIHEYVMYFKQYLYGKAFVVRTDHKALVFMRYTKKAISPQFQTWLANLSGYDFDLQYRKGEEHGNADGISRVKGMLCAQCQTRHEDAKEVKSRVRHIGLVQRTESMRKLLEKQKDDIDFVHMTRILLGEESDAKLNRKRFPFNLHKNIKIEDGLLVFSKDGKDIILVPLDYTNTLIKDIHTEMCHIGVKKLVSYMNDIFFWPNMQEAIQKCLRSCVICCKRKIVQEKTKENLIPIVSTDLLDQLVIDIAHMKAGGIYRYLLVIIDRFSKMVSLTALERQDEKSIFKAIMEKWIYRYGKPRCCLSDRGKNFDSGYLKSQLEKLGIVQQFSSPYQHQSNGLVERTIRTVRDLLATSTANGHEGRNWVDLIPRVEFCINVTRQNTTGFSPFEIVFGRKINLHSTLPQTTLDMVEIHRLVRENSEKAAKRMKDMDTEKRTNRIFAVGEKVLVRKEPQNRDKDGEQYEGPFVISKFHSEHQVELNDGKTKKLRRIEWLKRWTGS